MLSVVGLNECNAHWKMVPTQYCLPERTRGWWECMHINTAYFESYQSLSKHQAGGLSLWSINDGAHRVMEHGKDPRGLGWWAWTRFRGRQGISLRVVAAYCPVMNKSGLLLV